MLMNQQNQLHLKEDKFFEKRKGTGSKMMRFLTPQSLPFEFAILQDDRACCRQRGSSLYCKRQALLGR
jgi:hypothetical protein